MSQKILVADDSLTVQKVINITLSSYDYKIVECKDESELNEHLIVGDASLLLLDLNLSENKSGYEIAKSIRSSHPNLPIILLLGTFDTVDESKFSDARINDRIVKPFESASFTQKVQSLLENGPSATSVESELFSGERESNFLEPDLEDITPESSTTIDSNEDADSWVVDSPAPEDKSEESWDSFAQVETKSSNSLEDSLSGWGMNVPGPIGSEDSASNMEMPEVIKVDQLESEVEAEDDIQLIHEEEEKLPAEAELDYPDVGELDEPIKSKVQNVFREIDVKPSSALLSEDEFNLNMDDDSDNSEVAQPVIKEEADDFWAVDTEVEAPKEISIEEQIEDEEEEEYFVEPDETSELVESTISLEPLEDIRPPLEAITPVEDSPKSSEASIDKDEIIEKIMAELKPMLSELVEKHCKETIENVAWQIIPDLAENLIRNEIKEIKETSL